MNSVSLLKIFSDFWGKFWSPLESLAFILWKSSVDLIDIM